MRRAADWSTRSTSLSQLWVRSPPRKKWVSSDSHHVVSACNRPAGVTGANGSNGATGAVGAAGVTGSTGAAGPTGAVGATGVAGTAGVTGGTGPSGPVGPTGSSVSGAYAYTATSPTNTATFFIVCPVGEVSLGGGGVEQAGAPETLIASVPTNSSGVPLTIGGVAHGWSVTFSGRGHKPTAWVICGS